MRLVFDKIDTNQSGTIEADELRQAVKRNKIQLSEQELEQIVKNIDVIGNGVINYHEFIAAVFPVEKFAT